MRPRFDFHRRWLRRKARFVLPPLFAPELGPVAAALDDLLYDPEERLSPAGVVLREIADCIDVAADCSAPVPGRLIVWISDTRWGSGALVAFYRPYDPSILAQFREQYSRRGRFSLPYIAALWSQRARRARPMPSADLILAEVLATRPCFADTIKQAQEQGDEAVLLIALNTAGSPRMRLRSHPVARTVAITRWGHDASQE